MALNRTPGYHCDLRIKERNGVAEICTRDLPNICIGDVLFIDIYRRRIAMKMKIVSGRVP